MAQIKKCLFVFVLFAILQLATQEPAGDDGRNEFKWPKQAVRGAPALQTPASGVITNQHDSEKRNDRRPDAVRYARSVACATICGPGYSISSGMSGGGNSGWGNTGNGNNGNCNTGSNNLGNCNSGKGNTGNCNSGNGNTGKCNSGNGQSSNGHSGNCNFCQD